MKPIPSPMSRQAFDLMKKAQHLSERIDTLEKGKGKPCCEGMAKMGSCKTGCTAMEKGLEMVEHEGKKVPKFAADGKGAKDMKSKADMATKDKYCMKNFGKKYSECSANEKAQCDKAHGKADKDDKMKANTFTIADAQKRNMGEAPEPRQPRSFPDNPDMSPMSEMPMREDTGESDFRMSEGPPRQQKRGERRGVAVKRPGFRSSEQMPLSDKSPRVQVEKAVAEGSQPGFATSYDSSPMGVMFMSETGGQTRNAYYTTNQYPYNAEDVTNKGATSVQVSLDKLASMLNPHEGGGVSRLDNNGVLSNNPY